MRSREVSVVLGCSHRTMVCYGPAPAVPCQVDLSTLELRGLFVPGVTYVVRVGAAANVVDGYGLPLQVRGVV